MGCGGGRERGRLAGRENQSAIVKAWDVLLGRLSLSLDHGKEGLKEDVAYLVSAVDMWLWGQR